MKRVNVLFGTALVSVVLAGCTTDNEPEATTSTVTSVTTETQTVATSAETATPTTTTAVGPLTTMGNGTWVVGTDIATGTYSTPGPQDASAGCAYTYLPRPGASLSEATGGNTFFGPGYMDVSEGQVVQTINCTWTLQ